MYSCPCTFSANNFDLVMVNLLRNPNINSGFLFRADILFNSDWTDGHGISNVDAEVGAQAQPFEMEIKGLRRTRTVVRRLIPRNPQLDRPLLQTCHFYTGPSSIASSDLEQVVVYIPHASSPDDIPYYHPAVHAVAFVYTQTQIAIHYAHFPNENEIISSRADNRLYRTAFRLLETVYKHGHGNAAGYAKRVHHDLIIPQARYQDSYTGLKIRHAKRLVENWAEATDSAKHAFEDLGIATFLIEVWKDMYVEKGKDFPGFVDIGCGNGVLVDILRREGWKGWGFDARRRKSWATFPEEVQACLKEMVLVPAPLFPPTSDVPHEKKSSESTTPVHHDGIFPPGTFLISNHADELTGWTPILGAMADFAPFLIIPCCSHDLSGSRFRAPPSLPFACSSTSTSSSSSADSNNTNTDQKGDLKAIANKNKPPSTYAALVDWTEEIATRLGYVVEKDMLRIPSTRNTALLGRSRRQGMMDEEEEMMRVEDVVRRFGAGDDDAGKVWLERAKGLQRPLK